MSVFTHAKGRFVTKYGSVRANPNELVDEMALCSLPMKDPIRLTFLGGGVAAHLYTAVATELLGAESVHVKMIDPIREIPKRTLCVWGKPSPILDEAVLATWSTLQFGYGSSTIKRTLPTLTYRQYSAASIAEHVRTFAAIERYEAVATEPDQDAHLTLDSRPNDLAIREGTVTLYQHFHGWRIVSDEPQFDVSTATMMDFRVDQSGGVCFVYVLPYSNVEALVECTVFSANQWPIGEYERRLSTYIAEQLSCQNYRIIDTETGVIPMNDRIPLRERGSAWIGIGTAAGLTKPTTGYTVARCLHDAERLFQHYLETGNWRAPSRAPARFDWYDRLLLRIIRDEPQQVSLILWRLFERNPVERILRFLDEETTLWEEITLFWSLPWMPFLRAIGRA